MTRAAGDSKSGFRLDDDRQRANSAHDEADDNDIGFIPSVCVRGACRIFERGSRGRFMMGDPAVITGDYRREMPFIYRPPANESQIKHIHGIYI